MRVRLVTRRGRLVSPGDRLLVPYPQYQRAANHRSRLPKTTWHGSHNTVGSGLRSSFSSAPPPIRHGEARISQQQRQAPFRVECYPFIGPLLSFLIHTTSLSSRTRGRPLSPSTRQRGAPGPVPSVQCSSQATSRRRPSEGFGYYNSLKSICVSVHLKGL